MVDAIVSPLLEQLISISYEEAKEQKKQLKEESVRLGLDQLKEASYDMEDVLDKRITARLKLRNDRVPAPRKPVCSFSLSPCIGVIQVFLRRDIAQKVKEINENLDDIANQKDMFNFNVIRSTTEKSISARIQSTSLIIVSEVRGRDEEKHILKSKLLCESGELQNAVQIISLVGMGGIGKTTLAQFAYNDKDVIDSFEKRIWVCVSDTFDEFRIAKAIIEDLRGSVRDLGEFNPLMKRIHASISGKRFLLVLDDVWTEDYDEWEPFRCCLMNGLSRSKILVTTRRETVARMMKSIDVISIKELSEQECLSLFKRFAFANRPPFECEKLEEISRKIVGKCKGCHLPPKLSGVYCSLKEIEKSDKVY